MFDERSIINRILSGDDSSFERLVDLFEPKIYPYTLRYLGQEKEAEQATEEIFYKLCHDLGNVTDVPLNIRIFRIAANVCADIQRHKRSTRTTMAVFRLRDSQKTNTEEKKDLEQAIQQQLLRLTRQQREVILLRDLCGLTDEETSQILQLDEAGVRQRLSRGRKNLRDLLLRRRILAQPKAKSKDEKKCREFRELCSQYVDECISAEDKTALLDHIQECPQCAAYLNDLTVIGRALSHMETVKLPEELRIRLIDNAKKQSSEIKINRRRGILIPMSILVLVTVVFVGLTCSGILGGMYIGNTITAEENAPVYHKDTDEQGVAAANNIPVPDTVASNSYAFVIAAVGGAGMPELSVSATLLAGDDGSGVEYYLVENDFGLVQKLIEGMETIGYKLETVNNDRIIISSGAQQGLFMVLHRQDIG